MYSYLKLVTAKNNKSVSRKTIKVATPYLYI